MPQIDFGKAFSSSDKSSPDSSESARSASGSHPPEEIEPSKFRRTRLRRAEWANIIFTIIAVLGGLFCAFYFFNGAELLRVAGRWPREYLYERPLPNPAPDSDRAQLAASLGLPASANNDQAAAKRSGDPFSRATDLLSFNSVNGLRGARAASGIPSNSPVSFNAPGARIGPASALSDLGLLPRGTDALTQAFDSAVAELQRLARLDRQRTVTVLQPAVSKTVRHLTRGTRGAGKSARSAAGNVGIEAAGGVVGNSRQAVAPAPGNSATSAAQQVTNSMPAGGMGAANSRAGSIGGIGANGVGGVAGAMGGLGSGVSGLAGQAGLGGHGGSGGRGH